ncbi:MAG TPA: cupin domain-containing protein [Xanthomonadaceae bacterium]|jgi:quercetin dioxygenase-like cupin family protein|nr:cupin domain-containing protein [Xanthomonadaceae bacterium]
MTEAYPLTEEPSPRWDPIVVPCENLDAAIALYTEQHRFRLDMIMPADAPRIALVSIGLITLRLEAPDPGDVSDPLPVSPGDIVVSHASDCCAWPEGRAGMHYRDLIPGRLGGRMIASHIRIRDGGPVPDYVHYHKVGFQMIYCMRGWVRVVYEDQGPPFVMHAGDCVLQPPTIRHRVLESSPGLEVIEVSCPAVHETWRDHDIALPTLPLRPEREFAGQRFVHHVAATARWARADDPNFKFRDTGIADATAHLASVRVLRALAQQIAPTATPMNSARAGDVVFLFVLEGKLRLHSGAFEAHTLLSGDACAIPSGLDYVLDAIAPCEILEVVMNFASSSA